MKLKRKPNKHISIEVVKTENVREVLPENQDYKMFNEHLDRMDTTINDSEKLIESRTYEIGAGGLILSITILSLLRDTEHFPAWGMIPTTIIWGLFTLCIILHFWSQFISKHSAEKMSEIIHQKIQQNERYDDNELNAIQEKKFKKVNILNKIIPKILIFGIIVAPPPIEKKINAQSRLQPTQPSEDLLLMGREVSEVRFTSCKQFVNTPLLFYSTLSAELLIN